jgi:hypothetical protein
MEMDMAKKRMYTKPPNETLHAGGRPVERSKKRKSARQIHVANPNTEKVQPGCGQKHLSLGHLPNLEHGSGEFRIDRLQMCLTGHGSLSAEALEANCKQLHFLNE